MKKAQIISFDLSSSMVIFLIVLMVFIAIMAVTRPQESATDFEIDYVFSNIENNLNAENPNTAFLANYRISKSNLDLFADIHELSPDIDQYVLGAVANAHGIGVDPESHDSCMFFRDESGLIEFGSANIVAIGELKGGITCNSVISGANPCEQYKRALSMFKPVLLDEGNVNENRIIQMNLVMCEK